MKDADSQAYFSFSVIRFTEMSFRCTACPEVSTQMQDNRFL